MDKNLSVEEIKEIKAIKEKSIKENEIVKK